MTRKEAGNTLIDRLPRRLHRANMWVRLLLLVGAVCLVPVQTASGESTGKQRDHVEAGRAVFNGKGACSYCHGMDGRRDKPPRLEGDTAALIAQLNPPPADLRNPKALRLKTDRERTNAIRKGHLGTGMFPDTTMTDQELADTLAFLAFLRHESAATSP